jgi:small multidrug resistance pump
MVGYLLLAAAIVVEVSATLCLRMASEPTVKRRRIWFIPVIIGYAAAFGLLTGVLATGVPLGVAYGVWVAGGVALTTILGRILFKEPFTAIMSLGVVVIIGGVLLIELGSMH